MPEAVFGKMDIEEALKKGRLIAAHRGARSIAPENTLAAAGSAFAAGAGMWEVDVRMSRDGELVVIHDHDLVGTSDAPEKFPDRSPWLVSDFTLAELKSLDFGSWFAEADPFRQVAAGRVGRSILCQYAGERVLSLEDAILFTIKKDWLLNIEIKDLTGHPGHEAVVKKTVTLVRSLDAVEKVVISSFNHRYVAQAGKIDRGIRTGVLAGAFQADPVKLMLELGAFTYNPGLRAFRPRQIRGLKQKGFGVLVWVVNSPWLARVLFTLGVDGVFTDFPQRFTHHAKH